MNIKVKILNTILLLAGLLAAVIGAAMLLVPVAFHASGGIILENNINLLSEMRAPGALMLSAAIVILWGIFKKEWRPTAVVLAPLLYLSYGFARLISVFLDGLPSNGLLMVAALELLVGLLCVVVLIDDRRGEAS